MVLGESRLCELEKGDSGLGESGLGESEGYPSQREGGGADVKM